MSVDKKQAVRESVRKGYAAVAKGGGSCCGPKAGCCGGGDTSGVASLAVPKNEPNSPPIMR